MNKPVVSVPLWLHPQNPDVVRETVSSESVSSDEFQNSFPTMGCASGRFTYRSSDDRRVSYAGAGSWDTQIQPSGVPALPRPSHGRIEIPQYPRPLSPHSLGDERVGNERQIEAVRLNFSSVGTLRQPMRVQRSKRAKKARKTADQVKDTPGRKITLRRKLDDNQAPIGQVSLLAELKESGMEQRYYRFRQLLLALAAPSISSRSRRHNTSVLLSKTAGMKMHLLNLG